MLRSLRSGLVRFTMRRAAASQRDAPKRADWWLRIGCAITPAFAECYTALVRLRRAIEDRWGAHAAAQEAAERFPENPDAWMLLGEACQMVFRQHDALHAYEQVLALEERSDAALQAGDLYRRAGRYADAAARFARAYAARGRRGVAPVGHPRPRRARAALRCARRTVRGETRRLGSFGPTVERDGVREQDEGSHDVGRDHVAARLGHVSHGPRPRAPAPRA